VIRRAHFSKQASIKLLYAIALLAIFLCTSCGAKERHQELQSSISEVEKNADKLSPEDWEKYDKEIEQTKEKLKTERDSYTPEETEKINKLIGEYYVLKTKRNASKLKQDLQDASQQLKGAYEAIFKDDKDSLQ
jgi:uncharacterized Zn finger protein (UPF0148 family)